MKVFVTGAAGFVGSAVSAELIAHGHAVLGLARNDANATRLRELGAEVHRGDLTDLASLAAGALAADGVIHCAFVHDFANYQQNIRIDRDAVEAMVGALDGTGKPFVLTSATGVVATGAMVLESDKPSQQAGGNARGDTEAVALAAVDRGVRVSIVRLPQVHGRGDRGFTPALIAAARQTGVSAYVDEGAARWPAGHIADVARLYRLAVERAPVGAVLHAVGEEGVPLRAIAEAIGEGLGLPVRSVPAAEAVAHYGWIGMFAGRDNPSSNARTRELMDWTPTGPGLLEDLKSAGYFDS